MAIDWKLRALEEPLVLQHKDESEESFERRIAEDLDRKIKLLLDCYNVPRDDPNAELSLVLALAGILHQGFRPKKPPEGTHDPYDTVDNMILMYGIEKALQEDPSATMRPIIRALAEQNDWDTDKAHLETLRRRYFYLKKNDSRERRRMAEMAIRLLPLMEDHFQAKNNQV